MATDRADGEGPRLGYRPALDGLRALAIALVVLHHTAAFLVPAWVDRLASAGSLGVDLFFVLSGFLITTLLLERRRGERRPILAFYMRRALRLLPAVAALLAVNLAWSAAVGDGFARSLRSAGVVLTYTTNWAQLQGIELSDRLSHLWSLAIEEQFYLVWPLVLLGILALGVTRRRLIWLALALALAAAAWRGYLWHSDHGWLRIYLRTDARADSLLVGVALALAPWERMVAAIPGSLRTLLGALAAAALVVAAQLLDPSSAALYLGGFTLLAAIAAVLIAVVLRSDSALGRVLSSAPLVWLGRISYSLYLWHFPVFLEVGRRAAAWPAAARVVVGWSLAIGLAAASYRLIELPILRLKRRVRGSSQLGEAGSGSRGDADMAPARS